MEHINNNSDYVFNRIFTNMLQESGLSHEVCKSLTLLAINFVVCGRCYKRAGVEGVD